MKRKMKECEKNSINEKNRKEYRSERQCTSYEGRKVIAILMYEKENKIEYMKNK